MASFDALGFSWTRSRVPTLSAQSVLCVCTEFRRMRDSMKQGETVNKRPRMAIDEQDACYFGVVLLFVVERVQSRLF